MLGSTGKATGQLHMAHEWQQPEQPVLGHTAKSFVFGPELPSPAAYQANEGDEFLFWDLSYVFDGFRDNAAESSSSKFLDMIKELAVSSGKHDALHLRGESAAQWLAHAERPGPSDGDEVVKVAPSVASHDDKS